jgi:hypothetical protein
LALAELFALAKAKRNVHLLDIWLKPFKSFQTIPLDKSSGKVLRNVFHPILTLRILPFIELRIKSSVNFD